MSIGIFVKYQWLAWEENDFTKVVLTWLKSKSKMEK